VGTLHRLRPRAETIYLSLALRLSPYAVKHSGISAAGLIFVGNCGRMPRNEEAKRSVTAALLLLAFLASASAQAFFGQETDLLSVEYSNRLL